MSSAPKFTFALDACFKTPVSAFYAPLPSELTRGQTLAAPRLCTRCAPVPRTARQHSAVDVNPSLRTRSAPFLEASPSRQTGPAGVYLTCLRVKIYAKKARNHHHIPRQKKKKEHFAPTKTLKNGILLHTQGRHVPAAQLGQYPTPTHIVIG